MVKRRIKVQFYIYKSVHWPMFEELYRFLKCENQVEEIILCLPNIPNLVVAGNYSLVDHLMSMGERVVSHPHEANADITFIADAIAGKVWGCGKVVNVGHGTISKGYYFTDSFWTEREYWVDLLCVPGEHARRQLTGTLKTKVVATGMPKMDPAFSGKLNRGHLCELLGLDPGKKIVLYAPTFNVDLSSAYDFAGSFHELDNDEQYVLIKLHGSTPAELIQHYRNIAAASKNIRFIEDANLAPYIGGADVMISDVSSAFMEFMALDKPVILYDNPNQRLYHGYDPTNIEYAWRDLGTRVNNFAEMKAALELVVRQGDSKSAIRKQYRSELFADLEGNASRKVWNATLRVLEDPSTRVIPVHSIIIFLTEQNAPFVREQLFRLQFYSVMPLEIILIRDDSRIAERIADETCSFNEFHSVVVKLRPPESKLDSFLMETIRCATGDYVHVRKEEAYFYKNFDYIIDRTFQNNPECTCLTGLTNVRLPELFCERYIKNETSNAPEGFAFSFVNKYKGIQIASLQDDSFIPPLVILNKKRLSFDGVESFDEFIRRKVKAREIKICLSLFYGSFEPGEKRFLTDAWASRTEDDLQNRMTTLSVAVQKRFCSDMAEALVADLLATNQNKSTIRDLALASLPFRFYDREYKKHLRRVLENEVEIKNMLSKDIGIIDKLAEARNGRKTDCPGPPRRTRVLFYFFKNVHVPMLLPIYGELRSHYDVDIAFGYKGYAPEMRAGFKPDELDSLNSYGERLLSKPQEFRPDITFVADSVYPWVRDCGLVVNVGHGLLSKGQYYTNTALARREENADLVCVPGRYHKEILEKVISRPVVATGMSKLDGLFAGKLTRQIVLEKYHLPSEPKYVLFAPTFNDELSAIPCLKERIVEALPDDNTFLLIKLHGSTKNEYRELYRNLYRRDARAIYVDEIDITPFLALSDVLVSDVSSAMMEFAALDKPLILFNNPDWRKYQNYNPQDIEFKWRDIGIEVRTPEELAEAVKRSLRDPSEFSAKRKLYSDLLLANKHDGLACQRILQSAFSLLGRPVVHQSEAA